MSAFLHLVRSLVFGGFQVVSLVVWATLFIATTPLLSQRNRYRLAMKWPAMTVFAARFILGISWKVEGLQHLEAAKDQRLIVCAKHQSSWETLFLPSFLPRPLCFVFKEELLRIPFFGWGIGLLDMIHINRRDGRDAYQSIESQAQIKLDQGRWITFFPEGTRTQPGERRRYKTGAARLAIALGVPVLPIALNSGLLWPRNAFIKRPGCIAVSIGEPILPLPNDTPEAFMSRIESFIENETQRLSEPTVSA